MYTNAPIPQIGIYRITHVDSGHFYIGSSVDIRQRWWGHRHDLRRGKHKNPRLQNYWNKYGEDSFQWEIVEETERRLLVVREQQFLDRLPFFNINPSADRPPTSGAKKGHPVSAETRAKISKAHKGRKHSPEFCAKMSAAKKGIRQSAETRLKRSISMMGKNVGKPGFSHPSFQSTFTHCIHGHLLSKELRRDGRRKNCVPCVNRRSKEFSLRKKLQLQTTKTLNLRRTTQMGQDISSLTAEVERNRTVDASAVALINGIAARIEAAGVDPVALAALVTDLNASSTELADAVTANTPAEPEA